MYEALPEMPLGFSDAFLFALFKLTFENTSRVPSVSYLLTYLLTLLTLLTYSVTIHTYNTSGAHSSFFSFFLSFPSKLSFSSLLLLPPPPLLYIIIFRSLVSYHPQRRRFDSLSLLQSYCSPFSLISRLFIPSVA